jgi:hypothetical protein
VVERGLGSFLPPAELTRRDSCVFVEMKRLFSLALDARTRGKVTIVIVVVFRASYAGCGGVRRQCHVWCLALGDACWRACFRRAGEVATDAGRHRPLRVSSAVHEAAWC